MNMERFYMAIAYKDGYTVGTGTLICPVRRMGDVRTFATYAAADKAAKFVADNYNGDWYPGTYVSNR